MSWGIQSNHNKMFNAKEGAYRGAFPSHTFKADNAHADDDRGAWQTLQARRDKLEISRTILGFLPSGFNSGSPTQLSHAATRGG